MKIEKFEDIIAWQKSRELTKVIYKLSNNWNFWKDSWLKTQIQRASVSIMSNIAEWFERQTNKEFKQFLYIVKWSCWEIRCQLYVALDNWYITNSDFEKLYWVVIEISKLISNFIKVL